MKRTPFHMRLVHRWLSWRKKAQEDREFLGYEAFLPVSEPRIRPVAASGSPGLEHRKAA